MVMMEELGAASKASRPFMPLLFLLLSFSLLDPSSFCNAQGSLASDASALLAFINNLTIGSTSSRAQLSSWSTSSSSAICSSWVGVSCSTVAGQLRISTLRLPGKSLYGRIAPDTVSRLDALDTLSLRSNKLYGSIPADFASLSTLRKLLLQRNDLSGPLPSDYLQWPLLSHLDLSSNSFSGSIPSSMNSLLHLKTLYLQNNLLSGALPPLDRTAASLDAFNVSNNNLNGSIPSSLARFPSSAFAGNGNLCGPPLAECGTWRHKLSTRAIVGISIGAAGAALLLLLLLLLLCIWVIKRKNARRRTTAATRSTEGDLRGVGLPGASSASDEANGGSLVAATTTREGEGQQKLVFIDSKKLFDLEDLLRASAEVLGKGTLGTSYKAVLEDGRIVAVKRLRDIDESRREECRHRIHAMGSLRHDNVVPLRAYYLDKEENLLVYDFMQNGSLSALLHGSRGAGFNPLDWEVRVRIAASVARGLAAIHAHNMVHGNIKSSNVLLKSNLEGCLADYGLSPLMLFTPGVAKPVGYMAPEVTDPRNGTPKADVYSFGVLLLELLTGKVPLAPSYATPRPSASSAPSDGFPPSTPARGDDPAVDLPRWVQSVVREEWTAEVFDPFLVHSGQTFNEEEMVDLLQVAMSCVSPSPDQRPSMSDVVRLIDNISRRIDDDKSSSDSNAEQYHASTSEQV